MKNETTMNTEKIINKDYINVLLNRDDNLEILSLTEKQYKLLKYLYDKGYFEYGQETLIHIINEEAKVIE